MSDSQAVIEVKVAVRRLVHLALRGGDLGADFVTVSRAVEGTRGHRRVREMREAVGEYQAEVAVRHVVTGPGWRLEVGGRVDGIIPGDLPVVEEIKTVVAGLPESEDDCPGEHWAQAKVYGFLYALSQGVSQVVVRLCYLWVGSDFTCEYDITGDLEELRAHFDEMCAGYVRHLEHRVAWYALRNRSIIELSFPFPHYRPGQQDMIDAVAQTAEDGGTLFVEAPTGTGKTMAVLFPALRAQAAAQVDKIFFLTAKTTGMHAARHALGILQNNGLRLRRLTLTAKDKVCFCPGAECRPSQCPYSRGYYDRVTAAVEDVLRHDDLERDCIAETARRHQVCPFELALDASFECDVIICDYNYLFDPRVYLRRFFMHGKNPYLFLVDEAHNLVDRARSMYSAELEKRMVLDLQRATRQVLPELSKKLRAVNQIFIDLRKNCEAVEQEHWASDEAPQELLELLQECIALIEAQLQSAKKLACAEQLLEFFFTAASFCRIARLYDERYVTYVEKGRSNVLLRIFCRDPSASLRDALRRGTAAIFFSATLTPLPYYRRVLLNDTAGEMRLPSPFPKENRCVVMIDNIATTYRKREGTHRYTAMAIASVIRARSGNYMAYFPSYKYLQAVEEILRGGLSDRVRVVSQGRGMSEEERDDFLADFAENPERTTLGLVVMGGIFGESIDLVGERLSGVIVVGVGLPQICVARDLLRTYYDKDGFDYAYVYPGMHRVLQAAGRVIRSEKDRGVIVLLDERFARAPYHELLPQNWLPVPRARNPQQITALLRDFWLRCV